MGTRRVVSSRPNLSARMWCRRISREKSPHAIQQRSPQRLREQAKSQETHQPARRQEPGMWFGWSSSVRLSDFTNDQTKK